MNFDRRPTDGDENKDGDLIVWYNPQIGATPAFETRVPDVTTGRIVLDALSRFSLFEYDHNVKHDYADTGGIARWETNGDGGYAWYEVEDFEED